MAQGYGTPGMVGDRKPRRRYWFLIGLFALVATGAAAVYYPREPATEKNLQNAANVLMALVTGLSLFFWAIFLAGFTAATRSRIVATMVVVAVGLLACIREVRWTGNMEPIFYPRYMVVWNGMMPSLQVAPRHDDLLADARRQQQASELPPRSLPFNSEIPKEDFAEYRGRDRQGVVHGLQLQPWSSPPREVWRQLVGGGYAAFAVGDDYLVTIEQFRATENIVAFDRQTGVKRWSYPYAAHFQEIMGGPGPRATPTIAGNEVFSLGATGKLICLNARTGEARWETDVLTDVSAKNITWGLCSSPLVLGNQVVVAPGQGLAAYDRGSGKRLWHVGERQAGYCSPQLCKFTGIEQIVHFDASAVAGYDPRTGSELWHYDWVTNQGINVAQPLVLEGDRLFITSNYDKGCAMLKIVQQDQAWRVEKIWENRWMRCKQSSPVAHGQFLYGIDTGILCCLDQQTGERRWKGGRCGDGQLLLVGDTLMVLAEKGFIALVAAKPDRYQELCRQQVFNPNDKTWNNPAMAKNFLFIRNHTEMACLELPIAGLPDSKKP